MTSRVVLSHPSYFFNSYLLVLSRRTHCPAADPKRSQYDLHCQRAKDQSHYTHQNGSALTADHPQNYAIRVSEIVRKISLLFWRDGGNDLLEVRVPAQWVP